MNRKNKIFGESFNFSFKWNVLKKDVHFHTERDPSQREIRMNRTTLNILLS